MIAIDLGSNTLQVVEYDCSSNKKIAHFQKNVRTAQGLVESGVISKEAIKRVIEALKEAKKRIKFNNKEIFAVTTQALRVAKNQKEVVEEIYKEVGIKFRVISPLEEARLTLEAVKNRLFKLGFKGDFVLVDIGGGSTELIYYIDNHIYSKSFDLGIVTTANSCKSLEEIERFVEKKALLIEEFAKKFDNSNLIFCATAGTPTTIAAMKHNLTYATYDAEVVNGTILKVEELDFYLNRLLEMDKKEREVVVGVGRDDLIVAGIIIFKKIYEILGKEEAVVVDDGLSMGVALMGCKELEKNRGK
ncbi:MAG: phosphatase [Epsilonproteobacteria bacterium]|nr:phosphatase [Campylobacterota bacterium]